MSAVTVGLREHAWPTEYVLDDATGRALAASHIIDAAPDPYTPGVWLLAARTKVGAATVTVPGGGRVELRITPKVTIGRLFFLLGYAADPKGWRDDQIDVAQFEDLLPALAHAFERHTDRALRQGLLQGYRQAEESAFVVRGRIRHAEQIRRRHGVTVPVELEYDEFTTDITENRLLRAATDCLLTLPGLPTDVRRRLLHQRARLADVSPLIRGRRTPGWHPSRLNARYHSALHLAGIVLRGASVDHLAGRTRIDGFLFDMAKVFEDFVTVALREAMAGRAAAIDATAAGSGAGGYAQLQARHHLDEADTVLVKPDFVWYADGGRPLAVADAKYKAGKPEGFPGADLYQLLAYCTVLALSEGHLVYAKGNDTHASHVVRESGIRIHQHALDLEQPPAGLLAQIAAIAGSMDGAAAELPPRASGVSTA